MKVSIQFWAMVKYTRSYTILLLCIWLLPKILIPIRQIAKKFLEKIGKIRESIRDQKSPYFGFIDVS